MEIKIKKLNEVAQILRKVDTGQNDKLTYAVKKFSKKYSETIEQARKELDERIEDFKVNHAVVDEKGILIINEKNSYNFTPANYTIVSKEISKLSTEYLDRIINFEPYLINTSIARIDNLFDEFEKEELINVFLEQPTNATNDKDR